MDMALAVNKLHEKGCRFLLARNFKGFGSSAFAENAKNCASTGGVILIIQNEVIPDYTILVVTEPPHANQIERHGFYPVKKDRKNWIPIQYANRKGKEHLKDREGDYEHTTNISYLPLDEVHDYLQMVEKTEQITLIYGK